MSDPTRRASPARGTVLPDEGVRWRCDRQERDTHVWRQYPRIRQVSLIGATLTGNQGAAAMIETTIGELRARLPDFEFVVHSYFPEADRALCREEGIRIVDATPVRLLLSVLAALADAALRPLGRRVPKALMPASLKEIRSSAVLLDVSGISLADGRERLLPFNVLCVWPAVLVGTPVVKLSQAMGPMQRRITRAVGRFLLRRIEMSFARGAISQSHVSAVAPGARCELSADVAFLYEDRHSLTRAWSGRLDPLLERLDARGQPVVAISASSVMDRWARRRGVPYVPIVAGVAERLATAGYQVVVFPNAGRDGTRSEHNNDIPTIGRIREHCSSRDGIHFVERAVNTCAILKLLRRCDGLIASRFHAMVAGLGIGVPTLVLGWSHKYVEVMEMFGVASCYVSWEHMQAESIVRAAVGLMTDDGALAGEMRARAPRVRGLARHQFEWLTTYLSPGAP
jgi:colanic acid/amylovoran biosynthesis protein